jgi:hypothetical protein
MNRKMSIYGAAWLTVVGAGMVFIPADPPANRSGEFGKQTDLFHRPEEDERQLDAIHNHTVAQARVVRELIEGRLTLQQGAEQLHDLHAVNPYFSWKVFREVYAGVTDQERCRRQLLLLIDLELTHPRSPSQPLKCARKN